MVGEAQISSDSLISRTSPRDLLRDVFTSALAAVAGGVVVGRTLTGDAGHLEVAGRPIQPDGKLRVLAVGKAAAAMARAVEECASDRIAAGLVVTKDGHGLPLERCELRECAHPLPDDRNEAAADAALALARAQRPEDHLIVLLSGGASALLARPVATLTSVDLRATTRALLECGADITEMNCVRKHLSATAAGRLAQAAGSGDITVLAISDVPGDALETIGSGPCHADPTTYGDALDVVTTRGIRGELPPRVLRYLEDGAQGHHPETVKPGAAALARVHSQIVARSADAVAAALERAAFHGLAPLDLGAVLRGEAREVGRHLVEISRGLQPQRTLLAVASGETTVTVRGQGRGGRNQELALAAALELDSLPPESGVLLAAGTDGTDGPTDAAGAFADSGTVRRGHDRGMDARSHLDQNDSHTFFVSEGSLLRTGPTHTNVMDLALLWRPPDDEASGAKGA